MSRGSEEPIQLTTQWGTKRIDFVLQRESRRDLVISVHPDLRVHVRAPAERSVEHVLQRVDARRGWIARQLRDFEQLLPLPAPRFLSGETVYYLGREYRLRIESGPDNVLLTRGHLLVTTRKRRCRNLVRDLVAQWYHERAREVFLKRVEMIRKTTSLLALVVPQLRVSRMARRWGSCSPRGTITVNPSLVQAAIPCVDYVLTHELVHLLEPSHSPRFYRLLTRAMPEWESRKERLKLAAVRWE